MEQEGERDKETDTHTVGGGLGRDYYDTLGQKPTFKEKNWLHHMIGHPVKNLSSKKLVQLV